MLKKYGCTYLALLLCLSFSLSAVSHAQASSDVDSRVVALEKQLEALRQEIQALKSAGAPASAAAAATPAAPASAEPAKSSIVLSGTADVYYAYNANHPEGSSSQFRAFDAAFSQFSLNMAELNFTKTPDENSRLGFHVGLGYGQAMNVVNSFDPAGLNFAQYLRQAYASYLAPVGKGLQIDVGKFVTPHGAEVIETKDNWNYSRGLLFTYAIPFYHFGVRAKYTVNDKVAVTGFVVNGWNNVSDNNTGKTLGASLALNPTKKLSIVQNYMAGPESTGINENWRQLSDTVVAYAVTPKLTLQTNFDYGRGDRVEGLNRPVWWSGIAGYARYAFDTRYALAGRYEYYNDHDGFTTGAVQHLNGATGTFERKIGGNLLSRLEYRYDRSNEKSFLRGTTPVNGQSTVAIGLTYSFDSSETK